MSTPIQITLGGSSPSNGTLTPTLRIFTDILLSGQSASAGTLTVGEARLDGAFSDFAVAPYRKAVVYNDPLITYPLRSVRRVGAGDAVNTWKRLELTLTPPGDYSPGAYGQTIRRAAFARLGLTALAMPLAQTQQMTYVQFEKTPKGLDPDLDQFGNNLFSLEQASYEGRMLYEPTTVNSSFRRSRENPSCGELSGKYLYENVLPNNTYQTVQQFGTYTNLTDKRRTYAAVQYLPYTPDDAVPGAQAPPPAPPAPPPPSDVRTFTLRPLLPALVRLFPGVRYTGEIAVACELAGLSVRVQVLGFNANFEPTAVPAYTSAATLSAGNGKYQTLQVLTSPVPADWVWAAVVPQVVSTGQQRVLFWVDEHRLWAPTHLSLAGTIAGADLKSLARPWQPPRQTIVRVKPTRTNYARNPGFINDLANWSTVAPAGVPEATLNRVVGGGPTGGNYADYRLADMAIPSILGNPQWVGVGAGTSSQAATDVFDIGGTPKLLMEVRAGFMRGTHQNVAFDTAHNFMYVTQLMDGDIQLPGEAAPVSKDDRNAAGDICINQMSLTGELLKVMYAKGMGHASAFGVEPEGADAYIWVECDAPKAAAGSNGYGIHVARMKFTGIDKDLPPTTASVAVSGDTTRMTVFIPKPGTRVNIPTLDLQNRLLCLRWTDSTTSKANYSVYNLDVFKTGVFTELAPSFIEPTPIVTYQSHTLFNNNIYINEGTGYLDPNVPPGNQWTSRIPWATGVLAERVKNDTDSGLNWREPEALSVWYSPNGPRLVFGYSTPNPAPARLMKLWYFEPRKTLSSRGLVEGLKPSTVYTASVYVRSTASLVPVTLWVHDGQNLIKGTSTPLQQIVAPYYRLSVTFKTAVTFSGTLDLRVGYSAQDITYVYGRVVPGTDARIWEETTRAATKGAWDSGTGQYILNDVVTYDGKRWEAQGYTGRYDALAVLRFRVSNLLVEEAALVDEYFDGNNPSADYVWESAPPGNSASFYYRGKRVNQYRLETALKRQIPMGGSYKIVYGTLP